MIRRSGFPNPTNGVGGSFILDLRKRTAALRSQIPPTQEIRTKIGSGLFEFSKHTVDQSILRRISIQELREAIAGGEIIEDYPNDKYDPSCLIFGLTTANRPLHVQCSYPSRPELRIITLYEPDANLWVDFKVRKPQDAS